MSNDQASHSNANPAEQVAVVTGAAGGIGQSIIRNLASQGKIVAAIDRNEKALFELVNTLREEGMQVHGYATNISNSSEVEDTIDNIEKTHGPIHFLVNGAGVLRGGPVGETKDDDWDITFKVNVYGLFYVSRAVTNRMIKNGVEGAVVNIASNAAYTARTLMSAYAASKAAVSAFTKCLGLEMAEHRIRCNVVAPGSTNTEMLCAVAGSEKTIEKSIQGTPEAFRVGIPLKRVAQPSHIADAVMFLLSSAAEHITMETLTVDGGATLGV